MGKVNKRAVVIQRRIGVPPVAPIFEIARTRTIGSGVGSMTNHNPIQQKYDLTTPRINKFRRRWSSFPHQRILTCGPRASWQSGKRGED